MTEEKNNTKAEITVAPNINPNNHAVENELWRTLEEEVKKVSLEIDSGAELQPKDIKKVRSLRRQVEDYVKEFNRTMRSVQQDYKEQVTERLDSLGYQAIEDYVLAQRKKQTDIQNERTSKKLKKLTDVVEQAVSETAVIKHTALGSEMLPAFLERFPTINSGAKANDIDDWEPYKQVVQTNLSHVDTFLNDTKYQAAQILPIHSQTMQQLLKYIRSGNIEQLATMKTIFESDREILENQVLKKHIQSHGDAIEMIQGMLPGEDDNKKQTLINISKIITLALTLEK